jgi:hypothetical protein
MRKIKYKHIVNRRKPFSSLNPITPISMSPETLLQQLKWFKRNKIVSIMLFNQNQLQNNVTF